MTRPPNLAVSLTQCILILRKINEFDATRCQILRLKCTNSISAKGPTFKGREGEEEGLYRPW